MTATAPSVWEFAARTFEQPARRWDTPGDLARHLDPRTVQTPALDLIDTELVRLLDVPDGRLIISMPPQEGKSTRVAKDFPTWVLTQHPDTRIVTASYAQGLANRNGRTIRNNLTAHPELGLKIAADNGAVSEWQVDGQEGGVLSVGVGAGLTGRPADLLIIDDPIKDRREADSETFRENAWNWWTDVASTRLAPGAPVVLILTRWHEDDLAGKLLAAEDGHLWRVVNIPAQADHDPAKGETDPLGREPGEFMISARRDKKGRPRDEKAWEKIRIRSGARTWASLYQGRPSAAEGDMLKRHWWQEYSTPMWLEREDGARICPDPGVELIISADLAFKDTASSDYVAIQVWLRRGADAYLLDQTHARLDFVATCRALRETAARWPQALLKLVEDKANGPAVIAALGRTVPGIVPVEPEGGKVARVAAVSPVIEARNVWLPSPELAPWVGEFIEEAAAFPNGRHDDQVDAMSQALYRLLVKPLLDDDDSLHVPDEYELHDAVGYSISEW
ncbi:phage terminase large subunit [Desertihabitans brevis]|uniref:phage terminase large subunit n=1 Tax=Desertihabitans brevis TaxID=2268447 RepID=UPI001F268F7D|nr:phage terminase large subunit [Desertihabitans brevis]